MKKDKKLVMMIIYYFSFMFNFFMTYSFFKSEGGIWFNHTIGKHWYLFIVNTRYVQKFYIFFGVLCILSAAGIVYWTIKYNMDVISDETMSIEREIHDAWTKELEKK